LFVCRPLCHTLPRMNRVYILALQSLSRPPPLAPRHPGEGYGINDLDSDSVSRSVLLPAQPWPNAEAGRVSAVEAQASNKLEAQASNKLKAQASSKFPVCLLSSSLHVPLANIKARIKGRSAVIHILCLPPSNPFVHIADTRSAPRHHHVGMLGQQL
jgi:hypothetical protein